MEKTLIAFDTETTGQYALGSEICEIAAVKWQNGREVATFQSLLKPRAPMSDFVIGIHGITNEMVATAPLAKDVLPEFLAFLKGGVLLAHHAQFDLGFLAVQIEDAGLPLPTEPTICTSLLAQAIETETVNHKLQTLVQHYGIDPGQAHRALDDARACLHVALRLFEKMAHGQEITLEQMAEPMYRANRKSGRALPGAGPMHFSRFSMRELARNPDFSQLIEAARMKRPVSMIYRGGSRPGQVREILPLGIIRQLDGDSLVASEIVDGRIADQSKRYWLKDIISVG